MRDFLESRLDKWRRLEELTARASKLKLRGLSGQEVREFGQLYRRAAADLAIAREEIGDRRLVNYLNHLVGRAHGAIYRGETSGFGAILSFFSRELPTLLRETFPYTLASFLAFSLSALFAALVCTIDESFADRIVPGLRHDIAAHRNWTESINEANPLTSTMIQTNNITVTFMAFAGGMLFGLGTLYVLFHNGLMVGMVITLCVRHRFWDILIFISGHGVIELAAIFIAGGAGLMIGKSLAMPGDFRRRDALVANGIQAVKLIAGCIPMLVIAGLIEGFISPAPISPAYKISISAASALALAAYLLKPDKVKRADLTWPDGRA
jgi:uncharacterized membrane protein SpoIIM required for sporulation